MAIDGPVSDTSRAVQHEPDRAWPASLGIWAKWPNGMISFIPLSADQFFGSGRFGAPLSGDAIIGAIKNMVAGGEPPRDEVIIRNTKNAKREKPIKRSR